MITICSIETDQTERCALAIYRGKVFWTVTFFGGLLFSALL